MNFHRKRSAGFTLAELLVATMLLSIVMTSVYTLFYTVMGSWRAVEKRFETYREARNGITVFESDFDNMVASAAHLFEGKDDEIIMFVINDTTDIEKARGPHLMRVRYYYNSAKKTLIREEALVTTALPNAPQRGQELDHERVKLGRKRKMVVAGNVYRFRIQYVWTVRPEDSNPDNPPRPSEHVFQDRHKERWGLPQGLLLTMEVRDPEKKSEPFFIRQMIPVRARNMPRSEVSLERLFEEEES